MPAVRERLLEWYDANARDLPWRQTRDPYAVWVSEVMLQQTRVETVIPYYERFLDRFPTAAELAQAPEDEVLSLWSGLGYYRRARMLHRGVKEIVAEYGGEVPESQEQRRDLPGVGRYTAGAIGSIAFEKEESVVDGNVSRVLARLFCIDTELGRAETEKALWAKADELVKGDRPGELNQAVMELGAMVCTAKSPKCLLCPVRDHCQAHMRDAVHRLPVSRRRKKPRAVKAVAVVATTGRTPADLRLWLTKGQGALFGGLWGIPLTTTDEEPSPALARALLRSAKVRARLVTPAVGSVQHTLTHRRYDVTVFRAISAKGREDAIRRCCDLPALQRIGVSRLTDKILETALKASRPHDGARNSA